MEYQYSLHSLEQLIERGINKEWVELTLQNPDNIIEFSDEEVHFIKKIEEYNNRYLRVIVNTKKNPKNIITMFFDRRLKESKNEN